MNKKYIVNKRNCFFLIASEVAFIFSIFVVVCYVHARLESFINRVCIVLYLGYFVYFLFTIFSDVLNDIDRRNNE